MENTIELLYAINGDLNYHHWFILSDQIAMVLPQYVVRYTHILSALVRYTRRCQTKKCVQKLPCNYVIGNNCLNGLN